MASYIPRIQDRLRRQGFPIDVSGEVQEINLQGGQPVARRHQRWEFRTKDDQWSVIVQEQSVVLQTTDYTDFDVFLGRLVLAMEIVNEIVGNLVVERLGLRYIDLIRPGEGESWKEYVKEGCHGLKSKVIPPEESVLFFQSVTQTGDRSRMIARLAQNRDAMVLPPDLVTHPPTLRASASPGELVTLLDLDHFREERNDYSKEILEETAWDLHDRLDILFRDMVTPHALEVWK